MVSQIRNSKQKKIKNPRGRRTRYDQKQNRLIKKVYNMCKPEMKHYRNQVSTFPVSTAGSLTDLTNLITQGTSAAQRIGQKIKIYSIYTKITVQGADASNYVRFMMVRNQANVQLTLSDFPAFNSYPNIDLMHLYRDRLIPLTSSYDGTATVFPPKVLNMYIKFKNGITVDYTASGSPITPQILFYQVSDSITANHPVVSYEYIINFTDA